MDLQENKGCTFRCKALRSENDAVAVPSGTWSKGLAISNAFEMTLLVTRRQLGACCKDFRASFRILIIRMSTSFWHTLVSRRISGETITVVPAWASQELSPAGEIKHLPSDIHLIHQKKVKKLW